MSRFLTGTVVLLAGGALFVIGGFAQRPSPLVSIKGDREVLPPLHSWYRDGKVSTATDNMPTSDEVLQQIRQVYAGNNKTWHRIEIQQTFASEQRQFSSEGSFLAGPEGKMRLVLQCQTGNTESQMVSVTSAKSIQTQIYQNGRLARLENKELPNRSWEQIDGRVTKQILAEFGFAGVAVFVGHLQQHLKTPKVEHFLRHGKHFICMTGTWTAEAAAADSSFGTIQSFCRVYVDLDRLWVERLEWFRDLDQLNRQVPYFVVEFRNFEIGLSLSKEEEARLFEFKKDKEVAPD